MSTRMHVVSWLTALGGAAVLVGCAVPGQYPYQPQQPTYQQPSYQQPSYQQPTNGSYQGNYVESGRVTNIQYIPSTGNNANNVVGTLAGGAIGGLAGHQVGGGSGRTAATILGALGGALVGQAIANNSAGAAGNQGVYRVTVQFDNGSVRTFDYAQQPNVQIGDRVNSNGNELFR